MKDREEALKWWRNLNPEQQKLVAKTHFPNMEFIMISTSSSRIEFIWKEELKQNL